MAPSAAKVWKSFKDLFEKGLKELIGATVGTFPQRAKEDSEEFLRFTEGKLKKYIELLARDEIDRDDFEALANGLSILAKLQALKAVGMSRDDLERFRNGLINLVIDSAFRALGLSGTAGGK